MDATDANGVADVANAAGEPLYGCILAGGSGTRLWPLSARTTPKQFLPLPGPSSMYQETIARLGALVPLDRLYVVTAEAYAAIVAEQTPELDPTQIIAEPSGRGTAASIGLAAALIAARDPHAVMGSFPADHTIADGEGFRAALRLARTVAREGYLVTLGVTPTYAETGYGYIRFGDALAIGDPTDALRAHEGRAFVEKPSRAVAEKYLAAREYVWNAGIFVWRVDRILEEIRRYVPVVGAALDAIGAAARASGGRMDERTRAVMREVWPSLTENVTIDVGVMEKASRIAVIPLNVGIGWNDIGSWTQVATLYPSDPAGNVFVGLRAETPDMEEDDTDADAPDAACMHTATSDTLVYSTTGRRVATAGVSGLIIVDTPEGLLITTKQQAQLVKGLAEHRQRQQARRAASQEQASE
ncbi:MAG TPA: mannose-1-phosphate guanylyltransferase [Ktedonobacterales bacterium]